MWVNFMFIWFWSIIFFRIHFHQPALWVFHHVENLKKLSSPLNFMPHWNLQHGHGFPTIFRTHRDSYMASIINTEMSKRNNHICLKTTPTLWIWMRKCLLSIANYRRSIDRLKVIRQTSHFWLPKSFSASHLSITRIFYIDSSVCSCPIKL